MPSASNDFLTNSIITKAALAVLENTLNCTKSINRQYNDSFRFGGAVLGQTLNIRKPARFIGRLGQAANIEGIQETYVPLTLAYQRGIDTQVSSQDLTLSIDEYTDRILKPQIARLANLVDQDVCSLALGVNNSVGVPGTTPTAIDTYWGAKTKLDNGAAPMDGNRYFVLNPLAEQKIGNALYTTFNPSKEISHIYEEGAMGYALGAEWRMDQNVYVHTTGTVTGATPIVTTASQSGSTINSSGWSTSTLNAGDIVSFTGVNAVNPQSYADVGALMQFTVTATISDTAGAMAIPISPAMVGPGSPLQNVTALPAASAPIFVWDTTTMANVNAKTSPQNLMFHRDFGTLACVDLPLPDGTDKASRMASKKAGLSLRYIRDYVALTDQWIQRFDILYGVTVLRQELACRIAG